MAMQKHNCSCFMKANSRILFAFLENQEGTQLLFRSVKTQFALMVNKRNFWFGMFLFLSYCIISYLYSLYIYSGYDVASIRNAASLFIGNENTPFYSYFKSLYPFAIILPFSFSHFDDTSLEVNLYYYSRIGKKNFVLSKAIVSFLGSFLIVFIPFIINILLNSFTYVENGNTFNGVLFSREFCGTMVNDAEINASTMFLFPLYIKNQTLYNLLYSFLMSLFSGVLGFFAFACSLKIKKLKVLVFVPVYALFLITRLTGEAFLYYGDLLEFVMVGLSNGRNIILFLLLCISIMAYSIYSIKIEYNSEYL